MNATHEKGDLSRRLYAGPGYAETEAPAKKTKVGWIFPLWGRPEVFRLVLENFVQVRHKLKDLFEMVAICIRSPEDETPWDGLDWFWKEVETGGVLEVVYSNEVMGPKWNEGFLMALQWGADVVLQMGSDNLISWPYVERAVSNVIAGRPIVGIKQCVFFNWSTSATGIVYPKRNPFGYGPGRFYSSDVLDRLGWTPYPSNARRRMEAHIGQNLKSIGLERAHLFDMVFGPGADEVNQIVVDLKTGVSMNDFDAARKRRIRNKEWTDSPKGLGVRMFPDLSWPVEFQKYLTRWVETQNDTSERRN